MVALVGLLASCLWFACLLLFVLLDDLFSFICFDLVIAWVCLLVAYLNAVVVTCWWFVSVWVLLSYCLLLCFSVFMVVL